jgi:hypothetical protein
MHTPADAREGAVRVIAHIHLTQPDGCLEVSHGDGRFVAVLYRSGAIRVRGRRLEAADRDRRLQQGTGAGAGERPQRPAPPMRQSGGGATAAVASDELEELVSGLPGISRHHPHGPARSVQR